MSHSEHSEYIPSSREDVAHLMDEGRFNLESPYSRRAILQLLVAKDDSATKILSIEEIGAYVDDLSMPGRYQVIVDNKAHFLAVDISIDERGTKRCFILDAAIDSRMYEINKIFAERGYKTYMPLQREDKALQCDAFSCPYFAYEHTKACALMPDLYKDMERIEEDGNVFLDRLPPEFIKHAQSSRFIKNYCDNPKNKSDYGTAIDALQKHVHDHTAIVFAENNSATVPLKRMVQNWSMKATTEQLLGALYFSRHKTLIDENLAHYTEIERVHLKNVISNGLFNNVNAEQLSDAMAYYMRRFKETRAKLSETVGADVLTPPQLLAIDKQIMQIYVEKSESIKAFREKTLDGYIENYALLLEKKNNLLAVYGEEAAIFLEHIDACMTMETVVWQRSVKYKGFTDPKITLAIIDEYEAYLKERKLLFSMEIPDAARSFWSETTTGQLAITWDIRRNFFSRRNYLEDIKKYISDIQMFNQILSTRHYRAGVDKDLDAFIEEQKVALLAYYNFDIPDSILQEPGPREPFFSSFATQLDEKITKIATYSAATAEKAEATSDTFNAAISKSLKFKEALKQVITSSSEVEDKAEDSKNYGSTQNEETFRINPSNF